MTEVYIAIIAVGGVIGAMVAFKFMFTVDIVRWLEYRQKRLREKARMICPHTEIVKSEETISVQSTFISPRGTIAYRCMLCGLVEPDESLAERAVQVWASDLDGLAKRHKKLRKLIKKLT